MEQLTQKLKNGAMQVLEVPVPPLARGCLLVRNHYSLISAGSEGSTVKAARTGYLGKAKDRPQQVKQVLDLLKTQGIAQTYRAVMKKLDAYSPLGYSCVGEVIGAAPDVTGVRAGDLVACGGLTASHAEIVCVPVNLSVRLKPGADLRQAAYNTLGAIAMQGVRQADLRIGENCAVVGMGLLGQLTALILRAAGVNVVGIDIDPTMVAIATSHCVDLALCRDEPGIEGKIEHFTQGLGCDAVIITAASGSNDPINLAGQISRKRGTVVVVGAVPTGFDRDPFYYRKELQVRMSCSYGPGRYDPSYEEKGIDYPAAYVRWTERRNMQAFQELISSGKIDVSYLTTHVYQLREAPAAYDMLTAKTEPFIGILIEYPRATEPAATASLVLPRGRTAENPALGVGFIGAGSYAQSHLLPNIPRRSGIAMRGVMTGSATGARSVADRFGFAFCSGDDTAVLDDPATNTIFIATRHDSHAGYLIKALQAGKNVFVEKPLCLSPAELDEITAVYSSLHGSGRSAPLVMVGFNRRFAPLAVLLRDKLGSGGALSMLYRINAGAIPSDSWVQDAALGGGRVIGEVCHFIDFLSHLCGSLPVSVHATALRSGPELHDTVTISLQYANGSIGSICYFANGDKALPKERVEVFSGGSSMVLEDFRSLTIYHHGRKTVKKLVVQDKGQQGEVAAFLNAVLAGKESPIPFEQIHNTTRATFAVMESLREGASRKI